MCFYGVGCFIIFMYCQLSLTQQTQYLLGWWLNVK